jgi:hypothetical protein
MSVSQSVSTILRHHVSLEVESLDRLYLNVYVPTLQRVPGVLRFFRDHRRQPIASSALMAPISAAFVAAIKAFAQAEGVPLVDFKRGQRKDDIAKAHLARFSADEGVLFVADRARELDETPAVDNASHEGPAATRFRSSCVARAVWNNASGGNPLRDG